MNSSRNLVNRFIKENPNQNCVAENGSSSVSKEWLLMSYELLPMFYAISSMASSAVLRKMEANLNLS